MQQESNQKHGDTTKGQIDVEAPSPSNFRCERTAQKRPSDGGNPEDGTEKAHVKWSFVKRHGINHNDNLKQDMSSRTPRLG